MPDGNPNVAAALLASAVCVPVSVVTYWVTVRLGRAQPDLVARLALLAGGARGAAAIGGVVVLIPLAKANGVGPERFTAWVVGLYLLTLAVESALLIRWLHRREAAKP